MDKLAQEKMNKRDEKELRVRTLQGLLEEGFYKEAKKYTRRLE